VWCTIDSESEPSLTPSSSILRTRPSRGLSDRAIESPRMCNALGLLADVAKAPLLLLAVGRVDVDVDVDVDVMSCARIDGDDVGTVGRGARMAAFRRGEDCRTPLALRLGEPDTAEGDVDVEAKVVEALGATKLEVV
jgi:hypothetical protein